MSDLLKPAILLSFPVLGFIMLVGGLLYRWHLKSKIAGYLPIQGMIISNQKHPHGEGGYQPLVEYTVNGRIYEVTGHLEHGQKAEIGSSMKVFYSPDFPAKAVLVFDYYYFANALIALGSVFLLFGSQLCYFLWNAKS